jgi:hypothetical protein
MTWPFTNIHPLIEYFILTSPDFFPFSVNLFQDKTSSFRLRSTTGRAFAPSSFSRTIAVYFKVAERSRGTPLRPLPPIALSPRRPLVQSTLCPTFLKVFPKNRKDYNFKIQEEAPVFDIFVVDAHLFGVENFVVESDRIILKSQQLLLV